MEATTIHEAVREHYGELARTSNSCCSSSSSSTLYGAQLIQAVPAYVSSFSLGCGDPITLAGLRPGETVLDLGSGGGLDCFLAARQVGEEGRVPIDVAVQSALAACGATCRALPDPKATPFLTPDGLVIDVQVGCPSHCEAYPDWTCTYTLDAFTGAVLGGGEDCCVDCP